MAFFNSLGSFNRVLALGRKVKIYSVGQRSPLLSDKITEVEFEGKTVADLLKSIGSNGKTLFDEVVSQDESFSHGYSIALNGELVRCEDIGSKEIPNSSEIVVIHLVQIPGGG